jgi:uncharacterized repeat protein (TIGR01451 family)
VCSVNPNYKLVLVQSVGSTYQVERGDTLVYKIRFQNLGNDAARIVQVVDKLSDDLDWGTFEAICSSHDFAVSLVEGVVTWTSNNIKLPDSLSDPESSNGYIMFSILPRSGIEAYSII